MAINAEQLSTEHKLSMLLNDDSTLTVNTFVRMTGVFILTLHTFLSVQKREATNALSLECFFLIRLVSKVLPRRHILGFMVYLQFYIVEVA